jgi:hypothetical protein
MPDRLFDSLLRRNLLVRAGLETTDPIQAVNEYSEVIGTEGWTNKVVMVFGYGGFLGVAVELLARGATHVILCDRFAKFDVERAKEVLEVTPELGEIRNGRIRLDSEKITVIHDDIVDVAPSWSQRVDVVLSTSVFEHVDQADLIVDALAAITADNGINVHLIDLRDHYFKYPFEMLCYSDTVWKRFLNPRTNLNRLRFLDYKNIFTRFFADVTCFSRGSDPVSFARVRERIRHQFICHDHELNAVTLMGVLARKPRRGKRHYEETRS